MSLDYATEQEGAAAFRHLQSERRCRMSRNVENPSELIGKKIALGSAKSLYESRCGANVVTVTRVTKTKLVYGALSGKLCKYIDINSHEWTDDALVVAATEESLAKKQMFAEQQSEQRRQREGTEKWKIASMVSGFFWRSTIELYDQMSTEELAAIAGIIGRHEQRLSQEDR